tara:strand:+ start:22799 stop:26155 length:3357 start_codon:yes stop_codon:yes gene_type:complete
MPQNNTHNKVSSLRQALIDGYNRLNRKARLSAFLFSLALLFGLLVIYILIEEFVYLSSSSKASILLVAVLFSTFVFFRYRQSTAYNDFKDFYRLFCKYANLRELNYSIDLLTDDHSNPDLVQAAIDNNLEQVDNQAFKAKLAEFLKSQSSTISYSRSLYALTFSLAVLVCLSFIFNSGTQRAAQFWMNYDKPNPYSFYVSPGDSTFEQGSTFVVHTFFTGKEVPEKIELMLKTDVETDFRSRKMDFNGSSFESIPFDINNDTDYYVEMDGFKSSISKASVQLRPRFVELTATIIPPIYTKLDTSFQQYPFSLVRAYPGSTISILGVMNKELLTSSFTINNDTTEFSSTDSLIYTTKLSVIKSDTVSFFLKDEKGLTNKNPFRFIISPIIDEYPFAEIIEPRNSLELVEPKTITVVSKSTDDFGITKTTLNYELRKAYVEEPKKGSVLLKSIQNGVLNSYDWNLSSLKLSPLDELDFWIETIDNDAFSGYKTSQSQTITLTVPSLIDYFESLDEKETDIETSMDTISETFEEVERKYEEFKESLKENPKANYEQQKQLEEVQKQQEEVDKQIEELNKKFDEIKDELSENNLLSEETQKAYEELQKLMEEINDPALQEALQKLQEQMTKFNPEELRKAMEKVEFNEEAYKERIKRTMDLFKQLKLMSDLEKLAKSFEDQARQENEIQNSPPSQQELEKKREQDQEQLEKLKQALDKLEEYTSEKNKEQISEYKEQIKKELEDIQKELQKQSKKGSESESEEQDGGKQSPQKTFEKQFQEMASKTREAMESASGQQMQINIAGLRYVLYSLLTISNEQENLVVATQETESRSLAYINYAREQKSLQQLFDSISDSLSKLASEIPQFSNEISKKKLEVRSQLDRSLTQMAERDNRNSSVASRQAFGGINDISFMIANLLEQLQDQSNGTGGSGGGMSMQQMMEQMGEMGKSQQQLNQQLQDMINDMQGERLSQDQMERVNQMAKQQNQIRKQLQELQRNGGSNGDKIGSELQRMIEQMEDTINDLRGGSVDPLLIERQQNILSRMLESEKALQERDEEEKREGKTGEQNIKANPPKMSLEELEKQIRTRLNDPNFTKYSPDYQRLIERYFELLKIIDQSKIQ